jgi:hypothetical protein
MTHSEIVNIILTDKRLSKYNLKKSVSNDFILYTLDNVEYSIFISDNLYYFELVCGFVDYDIISKKVKILRKTKTSNTIVNSFKKIISNIDKYIFFKKNRDIDKIKIISSIKSLIYNMYMIDIDIFEDFNFSINFNKSTYLYRKKYVTTLFDVSKEKSASYNISLFVDTKSSKINFDFFYNTKNSQLYLNSYREEYCINSNDITKIIRSERLKKIENLYND